LNFKNKLEENFKSVLPSEKAAFLSGLTLGEREDFSKEFKNKMSLSGTTHLVALSGYNISIIVVVIMAVLGGYLPAAISFYLTALVIVLFVLMTGAEASVVRAAVMGIIMLLGRHIGREYSLRNAIVVAAFLMILFNPKILVFDLGFQLSFAALLGIIYLSPVIKKIFKISQPGVLSWKENAATTLSAQFAVAPLLLINFGFFSLSSFFANILILPFVPLAMGLGFVMGGVGFVSYFLAKIIGLVLNIFLSYMLWIIDIFSKITVSVGLEKISPVAVVFYYFILIGAVLYANRKSEQL
ncbi:MAG: competence protein ComEC, partial [Parcubacteria group bacterium Athens0714_26]